MLEPLCCGQTYIVVRIVEGSGKQPNDVLDSSWFGDALIPVADESVQRFYRPSPIEWIEISDESDQTRNNLFAAIHQDVVSGVSRVNIARPQGCERPFYDRLVDGRVRIALTNIVERTGSAGIAAGCGIARRVVVNASSPSNIKLIA